MDHERLTSLLNAAVTTLGGTPTLAVSAVVSLAVQSYGDPRRTYHNLDHVQVVMTVGDRIALDQAFSPEEHAMLTIAAICHDLVCLPSASDNERVSAEIAAVMLNSMRTPIADVDHVRSAILETDPTWSGPRTRVGEALTDADLSVLAANPETYNTYVTNVRSEYSFVSDDQWRVGRSKVLRALLSRPTLFTLLGTTHEQRARQNLTQELHSLR